MATGYILFNPLAGNRTCEGSIKGLKAVLPEPVQFFDMTRITNYASFLDGIEKDGYLVIAGGDGTLNRFANDTTGIEISQEILYYPVGTGNDFAHDLGKTTESGPFRISQYLNDLPVVEVKGKKYRFINGVGFGIDGYCCQVGDELKKTSEGKVNYTTVAIKGLLFHFGARDAIVTVDGEEFIYRKVWIAPTMHGRFYGGGMMAAPDQDRTARDQKLSLVIFHGAGRLRTLCVFPSIFKGEHVKQTDMVAVHTGHEITVEFDRPTPLQIDGETILDVTGYTVRSAKCAAQRSKECISI